MKGSRTDVAIVVVGALVLLLVGYERDAATRAVPPSVFSTYDTGPNGYRAAYETLRQSGVTVRRFARVLPLLDADTKTLVVSGYEFDPSAKPLDAHDASFLKRWVRDGGRFVALDAEFAGDRDATPGIGRSSPVTARDAIPLAVNRLTAGVERVEGPVPAAFAFSERFGQPLLANRAGIVAVAYAYGKGEVVAITAPALFSNAQIARAQNARLLYDAVGTDGPVAFDEYVHGYDDDTTFWKALPQPVHAAVWIVVAIVLLAVAGANVPFAPAVPLEPPDERDSSAYIDAMASLMRRARVPPRKDVYGR